MVALVLSVTPFSVHAQVQLAPIFSDHMVLQRDQPIPVWGQARGADEILVELHEQKVRAKVDAHGRWHVVLKPESAGGPYTLTVLGENTIAVRDVMLGDVWFASGQSNMEMTVGQSNDAAKEIAQSNWPLIRHIKVPKKVAFKPKGDIDEAAWQVSSPATAGEFSAAGYFFARKLHQELGVAVGIVNASWGGSNIETWLSPQALSARVELNLGAMPQDAATFRHRYHSRMTAAIERWQPGFAVQAKSPKNWREPEFDDQAWRTLYAPLYWEDQGLKDLDGVVWYRRSVELTATQARSAATLHLGMIDDCDETYVNGQRVGGICGWDVDRRYKLPADLLKPGKNLVAVRVTDTGGGGGFHGQADAMRLQLEMESIGLAGEWKARVESIMQKDTVAPNDLPTLLFNAMVHPLTNFPIKGVIWYQGESNVPRAHQYTRTFPLLIDDWRLHWKQPNLPFYFVQLASFLPLEKNSLAGSEWAELREAQRQALKLTDTGMVVATDVGDASDIHPRNKQAIGLRLALQALKNQYGYKQLVASGPLFKSMQVRGSKVEILFSELGQGLTISGGGGKLQGFTIAGEDRKFVAAQARIEGERVVVSNPQIVTPTAVRYGWVDNPEECNLFNRDGLPASPFRSDDWAGLTDESKYVY